jgi:energy-coupling factor transport system permease protein
VKLAWLIWGTLFVFWVQTPWAVLGVLALLVAAFSMSKIRLREVRGRRLFFTTTLGLIIVQLLFVKQGPVLLAIGPLALTWEGLKAGVYVAGRFLDVILLSYLFVFTTEPNDLAYGLMQVGLPYRYGFALVTALRLAPLFEQEGRTVYQAQLARGIAYDVRSPRRFVTLARRFFLPLLVSALSKVDALAVSMEGRCFGKYPQRTFMREVRFSWRDGVAVGLLVLSIGITGYWLLPLR